MICPVDIASDVSAFRAVRVGDHAGHGVLFEGRGGAGDKGTGSNFASDAKKITWLQAMEIIEISDRSMRRRRKRYEKFGYNALFDRRRGQPSPKRVPLTRVEQILGLHRDRYFDLNVQHFHEKLRAQHQIKLSDTWVKAALQGAGLVERGHKRGVVSYRKLSQVKIRADSLPKWMLSIT